MGVAVKKGPELVGAAEKRLFGRDRNGVSLGHKELHDAVGVPRCESGAEALQDLKQRGFYIRVGSHVGPFSRFCKKNSESDPSARAGGRARWPGSGLPQCPSGGR